MSISPMYNANSVILAFDSDKNLVKFTDPMDLYLLIRCTVTYNKRLVGQVGFI